MTTRPQLIADALNADADRRVRVALKLAAELDLERTERKADVRPGALKLVGLLAGAQQLRDEAERTLRPAPVIRDSTGEPVAPADVEAVLAAEQQDQRAAEPDGLSEEAHRAAALAQLDPTVLEERADGSTAEDDVDPPTEADLAALAGVGR